MDVRRLLPAIVLCAAVGHATAARVVEIPAAYLPGSGAEASRAEIAITLVDRNGTPVPASDQPNAALFVGTKWVVVTDTPVEITVASQDQLNGVTYYQVAVHQVAANQGTSTWTKRVQVPQADGSPLTWAEFIGLSAPVPPASTRLLPDPSLLPDDKWLATDGGAWVAVDAPATDEADPLFSASPAAGIGAQDLADWGAAYAWGDHGLMGYLLPGVDAALLGSGTATAGYAPLADGAGGIAWGQVASTETDPVYAASPAAGIGAQDITNWGAAYGWGDHAAAGYLTGYTETDPSVSGAIAAHEGAADPHPGYALESALGALAYQATVQGAPSGETDPDLFASTDDAGAIEMVDAAGARARLELGSAATTDASAYEPAGVSASEVAATPVGDVAATTVQGAIAELDAEKLTTAGISTVFGWQWGWDNTDLVVGAARWAGRVPMPYGMTVTSVACNVVKAPTNGYVQVDINASGSSILSTPITIDATELTSLTAATPPVVSDTSLAYDELVTMDIDAVGATEPGEGLKCHIVGVIPQ